MGEFGAAVRRVALALLVTGCGVQGPPELGYTPAPIDLHTELGKVGGSDVLAAPAEWTPAPTLVTPVLNAPAAQVFAALGDELAREGRTWPIASHPDTLQASYIVRSVLLNLPDTVVVEAVPVDARTCKVVILSRSRYDVLPFMSENHARVRRLLAGLVARFGVVGAVAGRS